MALLLPARGMPMDTGVRLIVGQCFLGKAFRGACGLPIDPARQRSQRMLSALVAALSLTVASTPANAACLPAGAFDAAPTSANGPMHVYWDGSLSMLGYVDGQDTTVRPLGDAQILLHDFAQSHNLRQDWSKFGAQITPARDPATLATKDSFTCQGHRGCDNKQSRMDSVLTVMAASDPSSLNIMVTDLWLDDASFTGSPQVALGGPLRALLRQGRSIGLVGVRAPYTGPVYDLPSKSRYLGASERPLFVLLVGPRAMVMGAYAALAKSGSPSFTPERTRFSLFTSAPAQSWLGAASGVHASGASALPTTVLPADAVGGLPQYRFRMAAAKAGGAISAHVDGASRVLPGAVWTGPLTAATKVYLLDDEHGLDRCAATAWRAFPALRGAWRQTPGSASAAEFSFDARSAAGVVPGRDYLVVASLGAKTVTRPNPADAWIRDWGFSPDEEHAYVAKKPKFFKTLNLGDVASLLEGALADTTPVQGRDQAQFGFIVKVER